MAKKKKLEESRKNQASTEMEETPEEWIEEMEKSLEEVDKKRKSQGTPSKRKKTLALPLSFSMKSARNGEP